MSTAPLVLEVRDLCKSFPGVQALVEFDFQLVAGEIHGLLGENGAGKSTFIKLLNGLYSPDSGQILVEGETFERLDPFVATMKGIRFVHQDLSVFPHLSVIDNVYMNNYPKSRLGTISWKKARDGAATLLSEFGLSINPNKKLSGLSIGQRQIIEIMSIVSKKARIVVLDEPTASLGDTEKRRLFDVMRSLKSRGIAVIFISHFLEEALELCDRITVVRDGRKIGTYDNDGLTTDFLIGQIVGKKVTAASAHRAERSRAANEGDVPALELRDLHFRSILRGASLRLQYGEIVSVLGLLGAGKTELAELSFGMSQAPLGTVLVNGREVRRHSPAKAIRMGIGYVTEDRHESGLFRYLSIAKNCSISILDRLQKFLAVVDRREERAQVGEVVKNLSIKAASLRHEVRLLSGGNQQKVLLGRWLLAKQKILILDEPTKGVDVGARTEFYKLLRALRDEGRAILILTSDHREALEISDRLYVLKRGQLEPVKITDETTAKVLLSRLTSGQQIQTSERVDIATGELP